MCYGFCFPNLGNWRRRHVVKPSSATRKVDLAEPEVDFEVRRTRVESPIHIDVTGESARVSLTFPHPYEKVVRRYPPDTAQSIEPSRTDDTEPQNQPSSAQADQRENKKGHVAAVRLMGPRPASLEAKTMRRHTTPIIISPRPPLDQLDLDLAHLSGDDVVEKSERSKPFSQIRPLPKPPVPTLSSSPAQMPSAKPTPSSTSTLPTNNNNHSSEKSRSSSHHSKHRPSINDNHDKAMPSSRRKRAATLTTTPSSTPSSLPPSKEKYYHRLPPSARYLADIARYPNSVDPVRPWNVLKDDHDIADVKSTVDSKDTS